MKCSFCRRESDGLLCVNALRLCPDCLRALMDVSPADREYPWFVAAVRRAAGA